MGRKLTGTLRQLASGRWEASVPLHTGSSHRVYATFDTELQADAWRSAQLLAIADGGTATKPDMRPVAATALSRASSPADVAAMMVEGMHARRTPGPTRRKDIERDLHNHVLPYLEQVGVVRIDQLTPWHLTEDLPLWLAGLGRYEGRTGHFVTTSKGHKVPAGWPVGRSTARNVLQVARRLAQYARDLQILHIEVPAKLTASVRDGDPEPRQGDQEDKPAPELVDCRRVARHLHVIHQVALWLQRILGLRIGEAYGLRVRHLDHHVDFGILWVREQGGALYEVEGAAGAIELAAHVGRVKTLASRRPVAVPPAVMAMLDVVVAAFHTNPDGTVRPDARLIPGLRHADEGGQAAFRSALDAAIEAEQHCEEPLRRFVPHDLRSGSITDLKLHVDGEEYHQHIQRQHGHRRGDDVTSQSYVRDVSLGNVKNLERVKAVVAGLQVTIDGQLDGSLMVPTAKLPEGGRTSAHHLQWATAEEVLQAHGWQLDADRLDGYWSTARVADACERSEGTVRRWLRSDQIPSVFIDGQYLARLADVEKFLEIHDTHVSVPKLAKDLGEDYHHVYRTMQRLGVRGGVRRGREDLLTPDDADRIHQEYERIRQLLERSMRVSEAARVLGKKPRTVRGWVGTKLEVDPESDGSGAKFVTRASVDAAQAPTVTRADVRKSDAARRLGVTPQQVGALIQRGLLDTYLVSRAQQVTAESLAAYIETHRPELLDG